jgi:hypothetical protein
MRAAASPPRMAPLMLLSSVISPAKYSPGQLLRVEASPVRACGGCGNQRLRSARARASTVPSSKPSAQHW